MSGSPDGHMMFCVQNSGYETIVNEIIALNTGATARPQQSSVAIDVGEIRPDTLPHEEARPISTLSDTTGGQTENRGSLACLTRLFNRYPAVTSADPRDATNTASQRPLLGRGVVVAAQVHAPVQRSTNQPPSDHARSSANTSPPQPQPFADGSSDVSVRRQEASSRSRHVDRNVTAGAVQVQARAQKTARPNVLSVIPNAPERKRPRQSAEDTVIWSEHFVQAWDDCDIDLSIVDHEKDLKQPPEAAEHVEHAADSDGDADMLPSNQEEYKNQQQNDANKEILNFLNTVVKNQTRIIENHQRAREEQACFNQTVTTTLQKHGIVLKQIIALQKRHDGGHEQTARNQEMIVTLLNELLDLFK